MVLNQSIAVTPEYRDIEIQTPILPSITNSKSSVIVIGRYWLQGQQLGGFVPTLHFYYYQGACVTTDQHARTITRPKSMVEDRQFEHAEVFNRHRRTSLASGPLQNGYFPHNLKLPTHNTPSKKAEKPRPPLVGTFDSLWKKRNNLEKGESSESREGGKFSKMGSTCNPQHERKR